MSREYDAFVAAMQGDVFTADESLETSREKLEAVHGHPVSGDVSVEWVDLGGVRCAWVDAPEAKDTARVLLLCHGGAYIAAGGDGYLFYAEMLSRATACRILLVDYRLAPVHRHPAPLEDFAAAYGGLLADGMPRENIGFIGDSCGGGFVIATLLYLRDRAIRLPALGVTLGGWFDLEATGASATQPVGHDPFANAAFTRARGHDYVGPAGDVRDPLASPIHADLTGLPPLLLQVGQIDLTRDDALRLAASAGRAGVDVTLEIHPRMIHGFQGLARAGIPECVAALARVSDFVQSHF